MTSFCYWQVYKDTDFYLLLGICTIAFVILIYILKQFVQILKVHKKLDIKILLIYSFCLIWAILYITKITYSLFEYQFSFKSQSSQNNMFKVSRYFCALDTLPTFFLMYLLILIPYFWLKNITIFLQKMKRNQRKDRIILRVFQVYIYLRILIFLTLLICQLTIQAQNVVEAFCDTMIEIILCQVFLSFCLLCYGLAKLFRNFQSLNLNDRRQKNKFRNQYLIMIGCSFVRFTMDFYFIILDKTKTEQSTCFQYRSNDFIYTTLYIIFGETLMHLAPIITILTIYRVNFQAIRQSTLLEDSQ